MRLNQLQVLSQAEIEQIHAASLDVLENCGVRIYSDKVLDILEPHGVIVDRATKLCKFPKELVEKCIAMAPSQFELYDRDGKNPITIGNGVPRCASGHNGVFYMDPVTKERRYSTVRDVEEFGIVSQAMESIEIVGVPLNPADVPPQSTLLHATKALFETTEKPLFLSTESCEVVVGLLDMMRAVLGTDDPSKTPNAIIQLSPSSPLFWTESTVNGVVETAKAGVPLTILPEPMSGLSAPYSVAGLLAEHNIEALSGIIIAQLVNPGCPVIYGSSWTTIDMRGMQAIIGSPESTILRVAGAQMARFYKIPAHTTATNTDSNAYDEQHAWESVLSNVCAMGADNDIVMNSGMFASGLTTTLEQLVMDNEVNNLVKRIMRGVEVNAESIAAEVIKNVGPQGDFMTEDHTMDNLYGDEFYWPTIRADMNYDAWMADGAPTADVLASRIAKKILAEGNKKWPGDEISAKLKAVIDKFEVENPG